MRAAGDRISLHLVVVLMHPVVSGPVQKMHAWVMNIVRFANLMQMLVGGPGCVLYMLSFCVVGCDWRVCAREVRCGDLPQIATS